MLYDVSKTTKRKVIYIEFLVAIRLHRRHVYILPTDQKAYIGFV